MFCRKRPCFCLLCTMKAAPGMARPDRFYPPRPPAPTTPAALRYRASGEGNQPPPGSPPGKGALRASLPQLHRPSPGSECPPSRAPSRLPPHAASRRGSPPGRSARRQTDKRCRWAAPPGKGIAPVRNRRPKSGRRRRKPEHDRGRIASREPAPSRGCPARQPITPAHLAPILPSSNACMNSTAPRVSSQ